MIARTLLLFGVLTATPWGAYAADTTVVQPRKKFRLHAVGVSFKIRPENPEKRIARPFDQSIGMMAAPEPNSGINLLASIDPPLSLASERYIWSGGASGVGPVLPLSYGSEGNRVVTLTVDDRNAADKVRVAGIRVRFVSSTREQDLCSPASPETFPVCPLAAKDSDLAAEWASSAEANARWNWPPGDKDNGRHNAAKHSYWNLLMTRDLGVSLARTFADAHERDPLVGFGLNDGTAHNGVVMDLDNNAAGRQIGAGMLFQSAFPDHSPEGQDAIALAINNGNLTVIDDATPTSDGNLNAQGLLQPSNQ